MYQSIKITKDVGEVSSRIKHALLAMFPRRRYVTGIDSKVYVLLTHLPTVISDFVITKMGHLFVPRVDSKIKKN